MKKLLALVVVLCTVAGANAQIVRSTTFQKQKSATTWYVGVGLSMNNFTGPAMSDFKKDVKHLSDAYNVGFGTNVGFDIQGGFMKNFGKLPLWWGMQLGFGTRGAKYHEKYTYMSEWDSYSSEDKTSYNFYTFKYTPFQIGYMFNCFDKFSVNPHLGIFLSVDMAGNCKWKEYYDGDLDEEDSYGYGDSDFDACRFDAGLQLGLGLWYDHVGLDFTWQRGFVNIFDDFYNNKGIQSSNAILSIVYKF